MSYKAKPENKCTRYINIVSSRVRYDYMMRQCGSSKLK